MKKTFKFNLFIVLLFVFLTSFIRYKYAPKASDNNLDSFSQTEAIAVSVKNHPDFPISPNYTVIKELPIGGPSGSTAKVKFTTKVELYGKRTFLVTLTKDWGITVNGTFIKSFWKYKVTPNGIELLESVDNDYLPYIIK
ncbi:MAG: hypothetical protein LIR50_10795 [Bacillota bacterium]|nr:hypothetical protein [Bacillota bacterium]